MSDTATSSAARRSNLVFRNLALGLLGGLVSSTLAGLLSYVVRVPGASSPYFTALSSEVGLHLPATVTGWLLTVLAGMTIGAIFGLGVSRVQAHHAEGTGYEMGLGVVVGVVSWLFFFLPVMDSVTPSLLLNVTFVGWSFATYLIFGVVLGAMTGLGQFIFSQTRSGRYECEICGTFFRGHDDLKHHFREVHLERKHNDREE